MEEKRKIRFQIENRVAHIVMDSPPDNRMDGTFFRQLDEAVKTIRQSNDIGAAVIYGSKRHFSAGADVEDIKNSLIEAGKKGRIELQKESVKNANIFLEMETLNIPVIAAVNGFCIGSAMELALACDMIFCSSDAVFSLPEITWGLMTGCSGSIRLSKPVNPAKAKEYLLTGDMVNARDAYEAGIVNRVFDRGGALPAAVLLAEKMALESRREANAGIKKQIYCSGGISNGVHYRM